MIVVEAFSAGSQRPIYTLALNMFDTSKHRRSVPLVVGSV
jgi:hypothetical protein